MSSKDKKTRGKQEWEGREGLWDATERFSSNLAPFAFSQKGDRTVTKYRWSIPCPTAGLKYKMRSSPRWVCCTCPGWAAVVQAPSWPGKYTNWTNTVGWSHWDGPRKRERQCCFRGSKDLLKASRSRQRAWEQHTMVLKGTGKSNCDSRIDGIYICQALRGSCLSILIRDYISACRNVGWRKVPLTF